VPMALARVSRGGPAEFSDFLKREIENWGR
jgi:hypothetical protein